MPEAHENLTCPRYVALSCDAEYIESDQDLGKLLELLRGLHDPNDPEEVVIWGDNRTIAAVLLSDGTAHVFEGGYRVMAPPVVESQANHRRKPRRTH